MQLIVANIYASTPVMSFLDTNDNAPYISMVELKRMQKALEEV
jgi:hypothetical protein